MIAGWTEVTRALAVVTVGFTTLASCQGLREEFFAVAAPVAEARIVGTKLYVRLSPGRPLSDLVTVPIQPLRPGMTIAEARRVVGEPLATRTDREGTYYLFRTQPARIELAQLSGLLANGAPGRHWSVVGEKGMVSAVFAPQIQELIARARPVREIVIHEQRVPPRAGFSAEIHGGEVSRLHWYSIEDMPE